MSGFAGYVVPRAGIEEVEDREPAVGQQDLADLAQQGHGPAIAVVRQQDAAREHGRRPAAIRPASSKQLASSSSTRGNRRAAAAASIRGLMSTPTARSNRSAKWASTSPVPQARSTRS